MENTIKIIAIGKGGYEEGAVEQYVIPFLKLDSVVCPEQMLWDTIVMMRQKITDQETINAKLKNKKK